MNNKDILEKAKKENKYGDEMYNYLYRKGAQIAMTAGLCICAIGMIVDLILNSSFTLLGYFMIITQLTMNSTLYGFIAIKYKKRRDIVCAVVDLISLILFIICLIIHLIDII